MAARGDAQNPSRTRVLLPTAGRRGLPLRQHLRAVRQFVTTTEFIPALQAQLAEITALHDDAAERGWDTEVARHARVITSIQNHLNRLTQQAKIDTTS